MTAQAQTTLKLELVSSDFGHLDYDVLDHPVLRRAKYPKGISIGEQFNVYHGESSKSGAVWRGSLEKSLQAWLDAQASAAQAIKPKTEIAKTLLAKLAALSIEAEPGYFGGKTYCVGVHVTDAADAFTLGSLIGEGFGQVAMDRLGNAQVIAFRDALVSR